MQRIFFYFLFYTSICSLFCAEKLQQQVNDFIQKAALNELKQNVIMDESKRLKQEKQLLEKCFATSLDDSCNSILHYMAEKPNVGYARYARVINGYIESNTAAVLNKKNSYGYTAFDILMNNVFQDQYVTVGMMELFFMFIQDSRLQVNTDVIPQGYHCYVTNDPYYNAICLCLSYKLGVRKITDNNVDLRGYVCANDINLIKKIIISCSEIDFGNDAQLFDKIEKTDENNAKKYDFKMVNAQWLSSCSTKSFRVFFEDYFKTKNQDSNTVELFFLILMKRIHEEYAWIKETDFLSSLLADTTQTDFAELLFTKRFNYYINSLNFNYNINNLNNEEVTKMLRELWEKTKQKIIHDPYKSDIDLMKIFLNSIKKNNIQKQ